MDVMDNPVVRALIREVIRNGQKAIAFLNDATDLRCRNTGRALFV